MIAGPHPRKLPQSCDIGSDQINAAYLLQSPIVDMLVNKCSVPSFVFVGKTFVSTHDTGIQDHVQALHVLKKYRGGPSRGQLTQRKFRLRNFRYEGHGRVK